MENNWNEVKLSDLGEVARGRSRHRPRYADHLFGGDYPFIQTGDVKASRGIIDSHEQTYSEAGLAQSRLWPQNTMCITIAANIAETGILQYPACFPDSVIGFIADENKCDVYFIEYLFRQLRRELQRQAIGSVQDNINLQTLERLKFKVPPLDEQKKIATFVNDFENRIRLNRQTNQTLEQMAQTLFKSWFVDFDPVFDNALVKADYQLDKLPSDFPEALLPKAEKRLAALNSQVNKQARGNENFPSEFEFNEQLGWIPKGWELKNIDELCDINPQSWTKRNAPEVVRYVDLANAKNGTVGDVVEYKFEDAPSRARRVLQPHDTIIGVVRPANRSFAYVNEKGLTGSTGFAVVRAKKESYRAFSYLSLTNEDCIKEFTRIADGAAYPAIKPEDVAKAECVFSCDFVLEKFEALVGEFMVKIAANEQQVAPLKSIRDTLLPKLISGELQISAAEQLVKETR